MPLHTADESAERERVAKENLGISFKRRCLACYRAAFLFMKLRHFGRKKILPKVKAGQLIQLALAIARLSQSRKAYGRGEITKEAQYPYVEHAESLSRGLMNMPLRELILTCRYFINL